MPEELQRLLSFIDEVYHPKRNMGDCVVFMPRKRWEVVNKQLDDWYQATFGCPYPFVSNSHKDFENFLCKMIPVVPIDA